MPDKIKQPTFIPMTRQEMNDLGWEQLDILLISGDAYVDHPSFGHALIGRWLIQAGYRVGIICQPNWKEPKSVTKLGRPRLFAGITAGAMDSMVANYTANKKIRRQDAYTPGGDYGKRPNRACIIYTNLIKQNFPKLPIVLGGIEASLRRTAHYDYWSHSIRRSLLVDSKADYIVYGMAELSIVQLAQAIDQEQDISAIPNLVYISKEKPKQPCLALPAYESIQADWDQLIKAALIDETFQSRITNQYLVQPHASRFVVCTPNRQPLNSRELDAFYKLPFQRKAHPQYKEAIPALESVRHSITTHRGCFGGCTFCAIGAHQGKLIQSRSEGSVIKEIEQLVERADFHGTITDVGGPSANMYGQSCQSPTGPCERPSCLYPTICNHLKVDHQAAINLLKKIKANKKINHVFVASGIRYDLALEDKRYLEYLVKAGHVSGTLKVAPEHNDEQVLALMRKPEAASFEKFVHQYRKLCHQAGKHDGITAYIISAFPGSTNQKMKQVANWAKELRLRIDQLQDFIPLPMTMSGIMYAVGKNPWTKQKIAANQEQRNRLQQRYALLNQHDSKKRRDDKV